ncbi:MAG: enolase C-terminal domain-like protein [Bacteroidia bacterium]|nr:enolase C-terminal domain-like protein [Bacteroidia bacterium]
MMNRRDFLKGTAAAGITAGLASCTGLKPAGGKVPAPYTISSGSTARMKLSFFPYELALKHTFTVSSYSRTTTPDVQVQIDYDGFTGYGEASMPPYLGHTVESVTAFLQKVDLGQFADPFCIDDILTYVDSLSEGDAPAKAAIDIALHDLVGQLLGQPLYRIWGYNPAKAPATSFTIGIDTADVVRQSARECAEKYRVLKLKVGLDNDYEMVRAIRSVTDLPIVVDANQGWKDREKALDEIFWLSEQGVQMVEQPMPDANLDDIAWITERSPLPVFADESIQRLQDIPRIKGAFSGINIKLMKCTGLNEARKMLAYAQAEGMRAMLGCMTETSCATTAAAHLSPMVDFADLDGNLLIANDRFEGVTVREGMLTLPDRPGLGLIKI